MTARMPGRTAGAATLLVVLLSMLAGCVSIPTSGPVLPGAGPSQAPQVSVELAPEPPRPGASPRTVVEGFLQAMASYQAGYPVAREYLAAGVRDSWRPEEGVTVYADGSSVTSGPDSAYLDAAKVGQIGQDGAFTHDSARLYQDFGLVREGNGEWRISNPPRGLLVSEYLFGRFYRSVNVYFYDPTWRTLVPDPVFVPQGNQTPTALLQSLLRGPTEWLRPAVVTAFPAQARLNVQSAFVDKRGVVEVSLNEAVTGLSEDQRSRVVAQIAWTLGQVDGVTGVRMLVNGAPWTVREQNQQGIVPISVFGGLDPIPTLRPGTLFGATTDGVVTVVEPGRTELVPLPGALGRTRGVGSMAASTAGDRIAVVTGNGTELAEAGLSEPLLHRVMADGTGFLRPQYVSAREAELWAVLDGPHGQEVRMLSGDQQRTVPLSGIGQARVTAFRISPDGTRMAVVLNRDGADELGLMRINRTEAGLTVDGWRAVPMVDSTGTGPRRLLDVGWSDASSLLVLGAEDAKKPVKPYRVDQNAATVDEIGQPDNWQAHTLVSAPRPGLTRATVVGRTGCWRYEDDYRWNLLVRNLVTAAYAG